jgi:phosphatidylglycerophosphate synthase
MVDPFGTMLANLLKTLYTNHVTLLLGIWFCHLLYFRTTIIWLAFLLKSGIDAADGELARIKKLYTGRYLDSVFDIF